jgi:plasmid stabilization system protein ParE
MAYQVSWSPDALVDLNGIGEFIARDSDLNARIVVTTIYESSSRYGNHPRAATIVRELGNERYRHRLVYGWRVIYRIDDDAQIVMILSVLHTRRQFASIQGRFLE